MEAVQTWAESVHASYAATVPVEMTLPLTSFEAMVGMNVGYLVVVFLLKWAMSGKDTKPYDLKWFRAAYNLFCVGLSAASLYLVVMASIEAKVSFACNNTEQKPLRMFEAATYVFYFSKFIEFTDTFIMCLRKKADQVSFLHVYHHSSISAVVWAYIRFSRGGDEFLPIALNSFVHVLMYSHYFTTTFGMPTPWKSYLTSIQLIQFTLVLSQSVYALTFGCGWPDFLKVLQIGYMLSMLVLFGNFYVQTYIKAKGKRKQQ